LASALKAQVFDECLQDNVDLLATSFGADTALMAFWQQAEFKSVRLGVQRDDVSGHHAFMMLRASSETGAQTIVTLCNRFEQQWLTLLSTQFSDLETSLVLAISRQGELKTGLLSDWDWQDVGSFANSARTYESCQPALIQFASVVLNTDHLIRLSSQSQQLLVLLLIQQHALTTVVKKIGYSGKGQLIAALRAAVGVLISTLEQDI
jgi:tRNA(Met) cytidine acetyltransferase